MKKWGPWKHDKYEPALYVRHKSAPDGSLMADYLGEAYLNTLEGHAQAATRLLEALKRCEQRFEAFRSAAKQPMPVLIMTGMADPNTLHDVLQADRDYARKAIADYEKVRG